MLNGKNLVWQPDITNTLGRVDGEFTYTYSTSAATFTPGTEQFNNLAGASYAVGARYNGDTAVILSPLINLAGFLLLGATYSYVRRWFANATWYTSYGGGAGWSNTTGTTTDIPYVGVAQADDPEAVLSFGAIAVKGDLGNEMLVLDVGQDMMLTTDASVGTEPQFKLGQEVLALLNSKKLFEV